MKKLGYIILFLVPVLCFFLVQTDYQSQEIAYLIFILNGLIAFIAGLVVVRRKTLLGICLILLGILAGILIFLITSQPIGKPKGDTAAVKAMLANSRAQAGILYEAANPHSYKGICQDESIVNMLRGTKDRTKSLKCFDDTDSFVITAEFKKKTDQGTHYCVDSSGSGKTISAEQDALIINVDTLCP